jgi:hypothetical protein
MLSHFPFMKDSSIPLDYDKDIRLEMANVVNRKAKINSLRRPVAQFPTASATTFANSFTSSSVVSNEHIQRTMHSSSIQS